MLERSTFLSPTSCGCFFSSHALFFWRDCVHLSSSFSTVCNKSFKLALFFKKLVISLLAYYRHIVTFLLAIIARVKFDLFFPFLYVNIVAKLLLLCGRSGFFDYQSYFDFFYFHSFPFYRQFFNLLPLLLYLYYSTLASIMSTLFCVFFVKFSTSTTGVYNG